MACVTALGRKVKFHSPAGSPQQADPTSAADEAEYQAAMKGLKGPAPVNATPAPQAPANDTPNVYKKAPTRSGWKSYLGGS